MNTICTTSYVILLPHVVNEQIYHYLLLKKSIVEKLRAYILYLKRYSNIYAVLDFMSINLKDYIFLIYQDFDQTLIY